MFDSKRMQIAKPQRTTAFSPNVASPKPDGTTGRTSPAPKTDGTTGGTSPAPSAPGPHSTSLVTRLFTGAGRGLPSAPDALNAPTTASAPAGRSPFFSIAKEALSRLSPDEQTELLAYVAGPDNTPKQARMPADLSGIFE